MRHSLLVILASSLALAQPVRVSRFLNSPPRDTGFDRDGVEFQGARYFAAYTDSVGWELFRSDGTAAGTRLVIDLNPGVRSSFPQRFQIFDGKLLFITADASATSAIWQSDGTAAGTTRLASLPCVALTSLSTSVLCGGAALWRVDASGLVTVLRQNFSARITALVELGGAVYFGADSKLWKTDGTVAGTVVVANVSVNGMVRVGNRLYFVSSDLTHGTEVWSSDGTAAGTSLLVDTTAGASIDYLYPGTTHLYFRTSNRVELWASDGVVTTRIATGLSNSKQALAGDTLFFPGADGELWKSDGTVAGTALVKELVAGTGTPLLESLTPLSATSVVFTAYITSPRSLYVSDGTAAGTTAIASSSQVKVTDSFSAKPGRLGNTLLFGGTTTTTGDELWKTDGTSAGTVFVKELSPGAKGGTAPEAFFNLGNALFFRGVTATGTSLFRSEGTAATTNARLPFPASEWSVSFGASAWYLGTDAAAGAEPWVTDGSVAGTHRFADLVPGASGSSPFRFTPTGSRLFFLALRPPLVGAQLFVSDGTVAGTQALTSLTTDSNYLFLTTLGGVAYLGVGGAGLATRQLWRSDGTAVGTTLVYDFGAELIDALVVQDGGLLISAYGTAAGRRQWVSGGTPATTRVSPVAVEPVGTQSLFFAAGRSFALVRNPQATSSFFLDDTLALWATDANGTWSHVKELGPWYPTAGEQLAHLEWQGRLLFAFDDGVSGREPWVTDGTSAGTMLLANLAPGGQSGLPFEGTFFPAANQVWFAGSDGVNGCELWQSDLTAIGTHLVADLVPGPDGTCPRDFTVEEPFLYSVGSDEGRLELYALSVGLDSSPPVITGTLSGTRGAAGWYTSNVVVHFEVVDAESIISSRAGCEDVIVTEDTRGRTFTCTATSTGGMATATLTVARDATVPVVTCSGPLTAEATSGAGAVVTFAAPMATDAFTGPLTVTASYASGATFPLGQTSVVAEARDEAGNRGTCSTEVMVRDTRAPRVTCPQRQDLSATSAQGAVLPTSLSAPAVDEVDTAPTVTWSSQLGSTLSPGTHEVTVEARDATGNAAQCTFTVEVAAFVDPTPTPTPTPSGCGCTTVDVPALFAALAALVFACRSRR